MSDNGAGLFQGWRAAACILWHHCGLGIGIQGRLRGRGNQAVFALVRLQKFFDASAQLRIAGAGLVEIGVTLARGQLQGGQEDFFGLLRIRVHG